MATGGGPPDHRGSEDRPFAKQLVAASLQDGRWVMMRSVTALGAIKGSLQFPFPQEPYVVFGVAVSPVIGSVFVSDWGSCQIHVFDVERKHVRTFGQEGKGGQLNFPLGIDVSANGQLYVANQNNYCVSVFREDGTFIRTIGQGKLQCPRDVFVHSSGLVYMADNHRIAVFSQEGELVRTFGSEGGGKGKIKHSSGVAISPGGHHLYVSDCHNDRVQVFTVEGQFVREFGTYQLNNPWGLTVTSDGSVLVADKCSNRVAVFNKKLNCCRGCNCPQH